MWNIIFPAALGFFALREICSRTDKGPCRYFPDKLKARVPIPLPPQVAPRVPPVMPPPPPPPRRRTPPVAPPIAPPVAPPMTPPALKRPTKTTPTVHPLVMGVASDIITKGKKYSRALLRQFQKMAKIKVDGLYGGTTAGALDYFLGGDPTKPRAPKPLFKPLKMKRYRPR